MNVNGREILVSTYAEHIRQSLMHSCIVLDKEKPSLTAREDEVISALAYACTLKNVRTFSGIQMGASEWRELADRIDMRMLSAVAYAVQTYGVAAKNRMWYVLGILAKEYKGLYDGRSAHGFSERRYTAADCARVITNIDNITDADL